MKFNYKQALIYGILFTLLTMGIEIIFLTFGFTVEKDSLLMAGVFFLIAPYIGGRIVGFKKVSEFIPLYIFSIIFTVILVFLFGDTSGNVKPLTLRPIAGFAAALIAQYFSSKN